MIVEYQDGRNQILELREGSGKSKSNPRVTLVAAAFADKVAYAPFELPDYTY